MNRRVPLFILLFLVLFSVTAYASCGFDIVSSWILLYPDPLSGKMEYTMTLNATAGLGTCQTDDFYLDLLIINGSVFSYHTMSAPFKLSCAAGSNMCYAYGSLSSGSYYNVYPNDSYTGWFTCKESYLYLKDYTGIGITSKCPDIYGSSNYRAVGTLLRFALVDINTTADSVQFTYGGTLGLSSHICLFSTSNPINYVPFGDVYFINRVPGCVKCTDGDPGRCKSDGSHDYEECIGGHWVITVPCEAGGFDSAHCGNGDPAICKGVSGNMSIANINAEKHRVTIYDDRGLILLYTGVGTSTGYYNIFQTARVSRLSFKIVDKQGYDWDPSGVSSFDVNYSWDVSVLNCTYNNAAIHRDPVNKIYSDESDVICSLVNDSLSNATLSVTVNATLSDNNTGGIKPYPPVLTETFYIRFVRDVVLLDDFQVLYLNDTWSAISGHIIRMSDLQDIPSNRNPYCNITMAFYATSDITTQVSGVGVFNATSNESNFMYYPVYSGTVAVGNLVIYNASCAADGYLTTGYDFDNVFIGSQRLAYLRCRMIPNVVDYIKDAAVVNASKLQCEYALVNVSAISPIELSYQAKIKQLQDVSTEYHDWLWTPTYLILDPWALLLGIFIPNQTKITSYSTTPIDVPYESATGYTLTYSNPQTYWFLSDDMGNPAVMNPGKYVGRWVYFTHPTIQQVKTYMQFEIRQTSTTNFSGVKVKFENQSYVSGDDITCTATWNAPDKDYIGNWEATISGEAGRVYKFTDAVAPPGSCNPNTQDCWELQNGGITCFDDPSDPTIKDCGMSITLKNADACTRHAISTDNTSPCSSYVWPLASYKKEVPLTCTYRFWPNDGTGRIITESGYASLNRNTLDLWGFMVSSFWGPVEGWLREFIDGLFGPNWYKYILYLLLFMILLPAIIFIVGWRPFAQSAAGWGGIAGGLGSVGGYLRGPQERAEQAAERAAKMDFAATQKRMMNLDLAEKQQAFLDKMKARRPPQVRQNVSNTINEALRRARRKR